MAHDHRPRTLLITIHGRKSPGPDGNFISATLFKQKFDHTLKALLEADRSANNKRCLEYKVFHLATGSATFGLREEPAKIIQKAGPPASAIQTLMACADAIYRSNFPAARQYNGLATRLMMLCDGADDKFDRIDISERQEEPPIPLDSFFRRQLENFVREASQQNAEPEFFRGQSYEAFEGVLGEIDFRGRLKRGILLVHGTRKEISCVFPKIVDSDFLSSFGDKRVWASGNAIFDGTSELPARLEVYDLKQIEKGIDPSKWKGALSGFEHSF